MCDVAQRLEDSGIQIGIEKGREEGGANMIYLLVQDGTINTEIGAQKLGITVDELKHRMAKARYNA